MRPIPVLVSALILAGCVGSAPRPADIAAYDFGSLSAQWKAPNIPIATVEVRAASWLDSTAQLYRLSYVDDLRRSHFAASRWSAPPAELLERFLQRHIVYGQPDFAGRGCRVLLTLDELEQRFDAEESSSLVLEAHARLLPLHGDALLSKRAFQIRKPAPTPDARGGVAAAREAAQALAEELNQWLLEVAKSRPQVAASCKGK